MDLCPPEPCAAATGGQEDRFQAEVAIRPQVHFLRGVMGEVAPRRSGSCIGNSGRAGYLGPGESRNSGKVGGLPPWGLVTGMEVRVAEEDLGKRPVRWWLLPLLLGLLSAPILYLLVHGDILLQRYYTVL